MAYLILLIFILAPAYVVRFKLLGYPTNLVMVAVILIWIVFAIWLLAKKQLGSFFVSVKHQVASDRWLVLLFLLAGIIGLIVKGADREKLGQFIVLFLQPISIFFIASFTFEQNPKTKNFFITACYFLLALAGLYALIQYFALLGLPAAYWGNSVEPKRALSFFVHPNFYALWCAPLLAFLIPDLAWSSKYQVASSKYLKIAAWVVGGIGLLLSLSRAGWLGLGAAIAIYTLVAADKKIRKVIFGTALIAIVVVVAIPNLRWRLVLPFYGEKSAISRISLWRDGWHAVKEAPITGLGLNGFAKNYGILNTDPNLDTHNFPHNIFLDVWVEMGLLGLVSFIAIVSIYIYRGLKNSTKLGQDDKKIIQLSIALFLIALLCQGLIDNPYFKNDLALVFWLVLSLSVI